MGESMNIIIVGNLHPDELSSKYASRELQQKGFTVLDATMQYADLYVRNRPLDNRDLNRCFTHDLRTLEDPSPTQRFAQKLAGKIDAFVQQGQYPYILIDLHSAPEGKVCYPHIKSAEPATQTHKQVLRRMATVIPDVLIETPKPGSLREYYSEMPRLVIPITIEAGGGSGIGTEKHNEYISLMVKAVEAIEKKTETDYIAYHEQEWIEMKQSGLVKIKDIEAFKGILGKTSDSVTHVCDIRYGGNGAWMPQVIKGKVFGEIIPTMNSLSYEQDDWIMFAGKA